MTSYIDPKLIAAFVEWFARKPVQKNCQSPKEKLRSSREQAARVNALSRSSHGSRQQLTACIQIRKPYPLTNRQIDSSHGVPRQDRTDMAHAETHESVPYRGTLEIQDRYGIASSPLRTAAAEDASSPIQIETLIESTSSWDGTPYKAYPAGQPQITIFKITIPPHTMMKWHSHPYPIAGYVLSGQLTIEKEDGMKQHFVAGQAVAETVNCVHRGITGAEPTMLLAFCPGIPGLPISR